MPFGLCNAPASLQRLKEVLLPQTQTIQICIIVVKANVTYLGHVVSEEGIRTDPSKLEAVQIWPVP